MASIVTLPSIVNPKLMPQNPVAGDKKKKLPTYKGMRAAKKKLPNMIEQSTKSLKNMPKYA